MIFSKLTLACMCSMIFLGSCAQTSQKEILVFSKTAGYRHESIETGIMAIQKLGATHGFKVEATEDAAYFTKDSLAQYDAILFLSTTLDILNSDQERSMQSFMEAGGGFVGVHAATDTEYEWPWYGKMVGAYFKSHPKQQMASLSVLDTIHPATKTLPKIWQHFDEWYNFKQINPDIKVLINLEESSYEGGENGKVHPIAWYQEFENSKMFYTGLGHTKEAYADKNFLSHLLGGIQYVIED